MNRKIAALFFITGLLVTFNFAQNNPEKTPLVAPSGLALEVTFNKSQPFAYLNIYENGRDGGGWFSSFGRIPNFKAPPNTPPINAVNVIHRLEKDVLKIAISIFKGHKFRDQEITVADFSLREGERISIKELTNFGVEPFEIAVVRVTPTVTALPSIVNRTNSLQVTGVEPIYSTLPTYKISLLNNSEKDIIAFAFEARLNNEWKLSSGAQNFQGETLIEPGTTYEKKIPSALQDIMTEDEQPSVQPEETLIILAVVFADGSYEGDAPRAARIRAFNLGNKLQLRKMIDFSPENLEKQMANLKYAMDENAFVALLKQFPTLGEKDKDGLRRSVDAAAKILEGNFLKDLESAKKRKPEELRSWLTNANENHRKWLTRLP